MRGMRSGGGKGIGSGVALAALGLVAALVATGPAVAVDGIRDDALAIRDAVGGGIHAFYTGDYARSYDSLTTAVDAGSTDARTYYFRGLSALKLGRTTEAEADFRLGADREAADGSMLRVSRSLERVQGPERLALEKYRARARLASLARERQAVGRRYSQIEDANSEVLRRRRPEDIRPELVDPRARRGGGAVEEVPQPKPAKPKPKSPFGDDEEDPFGGKEKPMSEDEAADADAEKEEMAAEAEDGAANRDQQNEVESAFGK